MLLQQFSVVVMATINTDAFCYVSLMSPVYQHIQIFSVTMKMLINVNIISLQVQARSQIFRQDAQSHNFVTVFFCSSL